MSRCPCIIDAVFGSGGSGRAQVDMSSLIVQEQCHSVIGLCSALPPATASGAERRRAGPKRWLQATSYEQSRFRSGTRPLQRLLPTTAMKRGANARQTRQLHVVSGVSGRRSVPTIGLWSTAWTLRDGKMVAQRFLNGCPLIRKKGKGQIM